jgi:hypothetical protein
MSIPIALVDKKGSSSADVTIIPKESPDVTIVDEEALAVKGNLRDDPSAREAFLSEFSAKESKDIMSKVDKRFFTLIGLMFLVKNVCNATIIRHSCFILEDSRNMVVHRWTLPTQLISRSFKLDSRATS